MGGYPHVALGGVEVFVSEQFLDLAQVRACAQQLGGEYVPERVWGDALALGHASGAGVAEEGLGHDRDREAPALHANEQRRFRVARPELEVVEEERFERGVDWQDALAAAFRLAH